MRDFIVPLPHRPPSPGQHRPFPVPTCCRNQNRIPCRYIHYPSVPREMGRQWPGRINGAGASVSERELEKKGLLKWGQKGGAERSIFGNREWNGNRPCSGRLQSRKRVEREEKRDDSNCGTF